jgi:hypothetical protein
MRLKEKHEYLPSLKSSLLLEQCKLLHLPVRQIFISLTKRAMAVDVGHSSWHGSKPGKTSKGIIIWIAVGLFVVVLLVLRCVGH